MNIPSIYREKIASSVVGTPGVDTSGQAIGEAVAQPAFELAEKQQAMKDEASYYASMLQHKQNMDSALEDIKIKYANNPDGAGPAMMQAIKDSQRVVTEAAPNPRVKLMVARGEPGVETWNMKMAYQWHLLRKSKSSDPHQEASLHVHLCALRCLKMKMK